jgi:hypothetical protein
VSIEFQSEQQALRFERYLKSGSGARLPNATSHQTYDLSWTAFTTLAQ